MKTDISTSKINLRELSVQAGRAGARPALYVRGARPRPTGSD
jgi:hypothetical protein